MTVLSLCLVAAIAAGPKPSVLLTGPNGCAPGSGQTDICARADSALEQEGLALTVRMDLVDHAAVEAKVREPSACGGDSQCLALAGRALNAWAVVFVDVVDLSSSHAVHIEAFRSSDGKSLTSSDFAYDQRSTQELGDNLKLFAHKLAQNRPPTPPEAPVAANLMPPESPNVLVFGAEYDRGNVKTAGWTLIGAAIACGVGSAVTGGLALDDRLKYDPIANVPVDQRPPSPNAWTRLSSGVNTNATLSLSLGLGAGALAAAGIYLLTR